MPSEIQTFYKIIWGLPLLMDRNWETLLLWALDYSIQIIGVYDWATSKQCFDENLLVFRWWSKDIISFRAVEGHIHRRDIKYSFNLDEV